MFRRLGMISFVLLFYVLLFCALSRYDDQGASTSGQSVSPMEVAPRLDQEGDSGDDEEPDVAAAAVDEPVEPPDPESPRTALLIACSRYDHLPPAAQLRGPVNDAVMMRELLTQRFDFPSRNVIELSERRKRAESRPLYANIKREFERLAQMARPGSQMVIYFSGHGAQQPNDDPNDPDDPEPDGLDEILCSADVKPAFDPDDPRVPNAISDDELRRWLNAIRSRGASVWVVIDACHSGTAIRGTEVLRQVAPELLVPRQALEKAGRTARGTRGVSADASPFDLGENVGGVVAIYAAQPHEPTIELPLPTDSKEQKWRGLLTYNLAKVLTETAAPVTYTELVQRIHREYVATMGRLGPVPLVEGSDRHREVLGTKEWGDRSRLLLQVDDRKRLKINAGRLHGLTPGSIVAVLAPAGVKSDDKPLGYVRIVKAGMTDADVEATGFEGSEPARNLPNGARCEVVRRDYGELRLRVAIDGPTEDAASREPWRERLARRGAKEGSVFELVDDRARAQWLVRPIEGNRIVLVPAEGWPRAPGTEAAAAFGPAPVDGELDAWLDERLGRIARATNLLRISGESTGERQRSLFSALLGKDRTDLRAELLELASLEDRQGKPLEWSRGGLRLEEGAIVGLRLRNASSHPVDFTVLFVDSGYGIQAVYPSSKTVVDNRLAPGASFLVGPLEIDATSVGLEHLLIIGVKADGQPIDFTWLGQSSLEQARAAGLPGDRAESEDPLGALFQRALFGKLGTRGLKATAAPPGVAVQAISWQSTPRPPAAGGTP